MKKINNNPSDNIEFIAVHIAHHSPLSFLILLSGDDPLRNLFPPFPFIATPFDEWCSLTESGDDPEELGDFLAGTPIN